MSVLPTSPIYLLALGLLIGALLGWIFRSDRCVKEKIAANAGLHEEVESQKSEGKRLADQNKSLMELVSQYRSLQHTYSANTKKLSDALQVATRTRDELKQQLNDVRKNMELTLAERDELRDKLQNHPAASGEKQGNIIKLSRDVTSWKTDESPVASQLQKEDKAISASTAIEPSEKEENKPYDNSGRDDLKLIRGVGPSIEKTFNDFGVYNFRQIAELTEHEMDNFAQQLKGFRSRIYREDWIGQARDLEHEKSNKLS